MNVTRTAIAVVGFVVALAILRPAPAAAQTPGQLQARIEVLEKLVATLQGQLGGIAAEAAARQAADTALQNNINAEAAARQAADTALQQNIDAEAAARAAGDAGGGVAVPQNLLDLANYLSVDQNTLEGLVGPHVIFTGANVHIRNGLGATNGNPGEPYVTSPGFGLTNGLGNFMVGYNEMISSLLVPRTGSHNLIVGLGNGHSSFGGFVAGYRNRSLGPYASVSGGFFNVASGVLSSISGGAENTASGGASSVSGGTLNTASGGLSSVSGGAGNTASGLYSSVSGGAVNTASHDNSTVSGGFNQTTTVEYEHVEP